MNRGERLTIARTATVNWDTPRMLCMSLKMAGEASSHNAVTVAKKLPLEELLKNDRHSVNLVKETGF